MSDDRRRKLNLTEKLASVLINGVTRGDGTPVIDREKSKGMSANEIVREFERQFDLDHIAPLKGGGTNHPANLQYLEKEAHKHKTNKIDQPRIAKGKRLERKHNEFRSKLLSKGDDECQSKPKPRFKRKLNGKVVRVD